jgi:hypothetical protein
MGQVPLISVQLLNAGVRTTSGAPPVLSYRDGPHLSAAGNLALFPLRRMQPATIGLADRLTFRRERDTQPANGPARLLPTGKPARPPARYAGPVTSPQEPARAPDPLVSDAVRDPLAVAATTLAARQRPMSERLELALSWNAVAAELRGGLMAATRHTNPGR